MANPYQAYGTNVPSLSYSNPVPTGNKPRYPPHNQPFENYTFTPSVPHGHAGDRPPPKREDSNGSKDGDTTILMREVLTRTPSPTPEEAAELKQTSVFDWKAMSNWRYWIRKEWRWYYLIGTIISVCVILFVVYHKQIVDWLHPAAKWMHDLPAGWLIPIVIFVIISFPPLFGHEILGILCGLVWGLGIGFVIVAAGTFLGEMANFYAFRYCCSARGEKYERKNLRYAYLVRVVRDGGFKIALIARFSAIPGHFTTAVFSTCGMGVWTFAAAAFLSLPKQFLTVYLGVALEQSETGEASTKDKIIKAVVISITTIVTILAMWWVYRKMNQVKPIVIYERRKARQAKLNAANGSTAYLNGANNFSTASVFNPNASTSTTNLPMGAQRSTSPEYQQWDAEGRATNFVSDPTLYAPQPKRPTRMPSSQPASRAQSPAQMSERERPAFGVSGPVRQDTASSNNSWNPPQGNDSFAMGRTYAGASPQNRTPSGAITKPLASMQPAQSTVSHQVPYSQQQQQSQPPSIAPPPYVPSPPASQPHSPITPHTPHASTNPFAVPPMLQASFRGNMMAQGQQPTPTQTYFAQAQVPPQSPQAPQTPQGHLPSPFEQAQSQPYAYPQTQPHPTGGHAQEATDATYYTAHQGHSRPMTMTEDAYAAYDGSPSLR